MGFANSRNLYSQISLSKWYCFDSTRVFVGADKRKTFCRKKKVKCHYTRICQTKLSWVCKPKGKKKKFISFFRARNLWQKVFVICYQSTICKQLLSHRKKYPQFTNYSRWQIVQYLIDLSCINATTFLSLFQKLVRFICLQISVNFVFCWTSLKKKKKKRLITGWLGQMEYE